MKLKEKKIEEKKVRKKPPLPRDDRGIEREKALSLSKLLSKYMKM